MPFLNKHHRLCRAELPNYQSDASAQQASWQKECVQSQFNLNPGGVHMGLWQYKCLNVSADQDTTGITAHIKIHVMLHRFFFYKGKQRLIWTFHLVPPSSCWCLREEGKQTLFQTSAEKLFGLLVGQNTHYEDIIFASKMFVFFRKISVLISENNHNRCKASVLELWHFPLNSSVNKCILSVGQ